MKKLRQLLTAARALAPQVEVRFRGTANEAEWVCSVAVGAVVLFESKAGDPETIVEEANRKLKSMSQKMRATLDSQVDEPPSSKKSKPPPAGSGPP